MKKRLKKQKEKEAQRQWNKFYYQKNREKALAKQEKWRLAHPNYSKEYWLKNKERLTEKSKEYVRNNRERIREHQKIYYQKHAEEIKKRVRDRYQAIKDDPAFKVKRAGYDRKYREKNREKINARQREYYLNRKKILIQNLKEKNN